jgi:protein involved in polysaccharide export with SLBB domain
MSVARNRRAARWAPAAGAILLVVLAGCGGRSSLPDGLAIYPGAPVSPEPYRITVGDDLDVDFFYQPDLSRKVTVRSDGRITLPGVGELVAAGNTPEDLAQAITARYAGLLKDPLVTVSVTSMAEARVYVVGEVVRPGGYALRGRMSLATAISEAGGPTRRAKLNSVMIVRRAGRDRPEGFRVDAQELEEGGALVPEIFMAPNDVVYVPRSYVGRVGDLVDALFQPGLYYFALLLVR